MWLHGHRGFESHTLRHFSLTNLITEFFDPIGGVSPVGVAVSSHLFTFMSRGWVGAEEFDVALFHFQVTQTICDDLVTDVTIEIKKEAIVA